jgi:hypothetical protein
MSVRRLVVAVIASAVMALPAVAGAATIRVTSATAPQLGNLEWESGSVRSYVDTTGKAHRLGTATALGQLVAATAFTGTPVRLQYFDGLGAYVARIGSVKMGPKSAWMLFVNGRLASVGAADLRLKQSDRALWVLDPDYSKKGPFVLDATAEVVGADSVKVTVTTIGGAKPRPAVGATIEFDGIAVGTTDEKGEFTYRLPTPATDWDVLQAKLAGSISSQFVEE